jgi:dUTPase
MEIFVKNIKGLKIPTQAHPNEDAMYDAYSSSKPIIVGDFIESATLGKLYKNIKYIEYQTNLAFSYPNPDDFVKIYPRSSIRSKNLLLCNSVAIIDNGFRGFISINFKYIAQPEDYIMLPEFGINKLYIKVNNDAIYQEGQAVAQIELCKSVPIEFSIVNELPESQRNLKGFGSSDLKN